MDLRAGRGWGFFHIAGSHLCAHTHTPECQELLLTWSSFKIHLGHSSGSTSVVQQGHFCSGSSKAFSDVDIRAGIEQGMVLGSTAGLLEAAQIPACPSILWMGLFDLCPTLHTQVPSSLSIFSPRRCFRWTLSQKNGGETTQSGICAQGKWFRAVAELEPVVLHRLVLIAQANEATHPSR